MKKPKMAEKPGYELRDIDKKTASEKNYKW